MSEGKVSVSMGETGNSFACSLQGGYLDAEKEKRGTACFCEPSQADNVVVAIPVDSRCAPFASVAIESVMRNARFQTSLEFVVIDAGLTDADRCFLLRQVSTRGKASLSFVRLQDSPKPNSLFTLEHLGAVTFAKLTAAECLGAYSKVVLLDPFVVCNTNIEDLYAVDLSDFVLAAAHDSQATSGLEADCFDTGIMVVDVAAFASTFRRDIVTEMIADSRLTWIEQDVFNRVSHDRVCYLDGLNIRIVSEDTVSADSLDCLSETETFDSEYGLVRFEGNVLPPFCPYSCYAPVFWSYARFTPYYELLMDMLFAGIKDAPSGYFRHAVPLAKTGPLVSIVMPVYNSAEFLGEALDSLLGQTYSNMEVICVNDGSKDNSLDILQEYAKRDARIVVVDKENSGAGSTRNVGMGYIRGAFTCFVDSDDFLECNAIETLVNAAVKTNADAVVFDLDQYDHVSKTFSPNDWAVVRDRIPVRTVFYPADIGNFYKYLVGFTVNKLYKSSFLLGLDLKFPKVGAHEDMPFTYLALSAAKRVYYLDSALYHYRRSREGSLSDGTNNQYVYMFDALDCLREGLVERGLWDDYERSFKSYVLHMCIWKHSELGRFRRLEFRDSCRTRWFEHFDIARCNREFFFDGDDYNFIENTVRMPLSRRVLAGLYRQYKRLR